MIVLLTNKGYITRFGFTDNREKALRFWRKKSANKKAIRTMRTGNVNFIKFYESSVR